MPGTILFGLDVETASEDAVGFAERGRELFHELNVPTTWYLTGQTLERYPDLFGEVDADELIELQAHVEGQESQAAREVEARIWRELRASTERRALSLDPF